MSDISSSAPGRLVAYLRGAVGGKLRTVVRYRADDHRVLYGEDGAAEARAALQGVDRDGDGGPAGDHHGTVRVHDDALLLHLPEGGAQGTLVTAAPDALSEVHDLVRGSRHHLENGTNGPNPT
jgi:hypothetical protein